MPEGPLQDWQAWNLSFKHSPRLLHELNVGRTNQSYLIEAEQQLWVLRINAKNSKVLGIDRQREKLILEHASTAGLAPKVLYCSVEHGILITEFIDGQHWQPAELKEPEKLSLLTETLSKLHSLPVTTPPFDYRQHAENYWQQLSEIHFNVPDELHNQREKILQLIEDISATNVICHHDPNPKNIIEQSGKLYFLDWEYAASAWPAFDFAALSVEWNISVDKLALPIDLDIDEIEKAKELYQYLCGLWSCIQNNDSSTG